ncbi:MAG: hypothetical protein MPEBLZ_03444 [Candidatus Methanoperedens nitroreducens]|uniref:Uncharacterized protein n=1 Tax=Candidatus Methanoperedens nitratireducens TaxID=1392998 RepID=A0A0P8A609_9EURY|nr:hypothetical protein [Candidatus Methanoperedens sp. BLZ2]KPQ42004.1 MAG: hypothetical protein MPEBLZ_03444 [Candidatus Methanoperedens sp. BLZ1]CAG0959209.1 hypothetical protein METP2_00684 [Methanosarcinales archaeon]
MDTFNILTYICKKRDEFVAKGLNSQEALIKAERAVAEEYHICFASINKLGV